MIVQWLTMRNNNGDSEEIAQKSIDLLRVVLKKSFLYWSI